MRAVQAIRPASSGGARFPRATRDHDVNFTSHFNGSHSSADTSVQSARGALSDNENEDWDKTAAFSDGMGSKSSLTTDQRLMEEEPSLLFEFFTLLCYYHGATHVPNSWVSLLANPTEPAAEQKTPEDGKGGDDAATTPTAEAAAAAAATEERQTKNDANRNEEDAEEDSDDSFLSRVTTLDFSRCYVGPTMLLALADLCRVRSVGFPVRHRPVSAAYLRTCNVVVTAVAPLWSSSNKITNDTPPSVNAPEMCSLLPWLTEVHLTHLSLDFEESATTHAAQHGNRVLLYVLEALQGHPRLRLLDVSGNPIGAALLPALSRLIQSTPSLISVKVEDTLLTKADKEMLEAQCLRNRLRLERNATAAAATPSEPNAQDTLSLLQRKWSAQTRKEVEGALEVGTSAVPWLLGKSTPYVRRYTGPHSRAAAPSSTSASFASVSRVSGRHKSPSTATVNSTVMGGSTTFGLVHSLRLGSAMTYLCYDPACHTSTSASSVSKSAAAAPETATRAGVVWSPECTEVVRAAFLDRQVARQKVTGGRAVWPNVPLPDDAESNAADTAAENGASEARDAGSTSRPSVEALSSSRLLQSVRQQLLPLPQVPPGLSHTADAAFLTTAEENYWTTRHTQEQQWAYWVARIADHLEPHLLHTDEELYAAGESSSSYVYFLPPELAETQAYVRLQAGDTENRVLPGQWVGEAEALGCMSLFANVCTATGNATSATTAVSSSMHSLLGSSPFARTSTAIAHTGVRAAMTLWALPFPVAFFYLFAPYQQLQQGFMQRTPMSAFAQIHPVHLATVPVQLSSTLWTRSATTAAQRSAAAASFLCDAEFMSHNVILLQEGEYLLRLPARLPPAKASLSHRAGAPPLPVVVEMEERHLLSGNALVTQAVLDLDAAARAADTADTTGEAPLAGSALGDARPLGKEAALRRYRLQKSAAASASARPSTSASAITMAAAALSSAQGNGEALEYSQDEPELRPYPSNAPTAHWRYAALPNDAFAALNPALRIALTRHCCVVPSVD